MDKWDKELMSLIRTSFVIQRTANRGTKHR
jgi:hypothetical protein